MRHTFKVTYPDGDMEYWHNSIAEVIPELKRLQKLHNDKIQIDLVPWMPSAPWGYHKPVVKVSGGGDAPFAKHDGE